MSDTLEQNIKTEAKERYSSWKYGAGNIYDFKFADCFIEGAKWMHEQSKARESVLLKALNKIGLGESQFDNVDHMYTARETLEEYKKLGGG